MAETKTGSSRLMTINMGPQHPATHGVLRIVLELDGETVVSATPHLGYLHTGIEKHSETKTYYKNIVQFDRLDYLAPMMNNIAYVGALEKLSGIKAPPRARVIRVLMLELTRIKSHLVWLASAALDLGAMTVFLYCFREREAITKMYEALSGARMMSSWFCPGGIRGDLPDGFEEMVRSFLDEFPDRLAEYRGLLEKNPIFLKRTKEIGYISKEEAIACALTGPVARASGVDMDIRRDNPHDGYENYQFSVPVRTEGDCYARYLVRIEEMIQARKIALQALDKLPDGPVRANHPVYVAPDREEIHQNMEALIRHFKFFTSGFNVPTGEVYFATETGKGEMGFYIVSTGEAKPYRLKIRSPSFVNLSIMPRIAPGHMVSDMVAIIGSLDIVLGEIDR
ncbi:MAG: NADH dehydrogenase (quinone) subunit D [bacterium]